MLLLTNWVLFKTIDLREVNKVTDLEDLEDLGAETKTDTKTLLEKILLNNKMMLDLFRVMEVD